MLIIIRFPLQSTNPADPSTVAASRPRNRERTQRHPHPRQNVPSGLERSREPVAGLATNSFCSVPFCKKSLIESFLCEQQWEMAAATIPDIVPGLKAYILMCL